MVIKFKKYPKMKDGDPHPHHATMDIQTNWIRFNKGHYVTRPYQKYVTSKWEQSMLDVYEVLFDPFKHAPISMLELGVYAGESMRYFREYFTHPDTKLVGADHALPESYHEGLPAGTDYIMELGKQENVGFREKLISHGPFDVIMDDASHDVDLTDATFRHLWPHVKSEGFYIIEDMSYEEMHHLLDEVVVTKQGKGFISRDSRGFGPAETVGGGTIVVLKKTKNLMVGIDEVLTDE